MTVENEQASPTQNVSIPHSAVILVVAVVAMLVQAAGLAATVETGELRIEGEGIEQLILAGSQGRSTQLDHPEGTVTIPAGRYRARKLTLEGGFACYEARNVTIEPNEPAVLKIGGPLRQDLRVERHGRTLRLSHRLLGQGGEQYRPVRRGEAPGFTVYRADRKIASGQFEYG